MSSIGALSKDQCLARPCAAGSYRSTTGGIAQNGTQRRSKSAILGSVLQPVNEKCHAKRHESPWLRQVVYLSRDNVQTSPALGTPARNKDHSPRVPSWTTDGWPCSRMNCFVTRPRRIAPALLGSEGGTKARVVVAGLSATGRRPLRLVPWRTESTAGEPPNPPGHPCWCRGDKSTARPSRRHGRQLQPAVGHSRRTGQGRHLDLLRDLRWNAASWRISRESWRTLPGHEQSSRCSIVSSDIRMPVLPYSSAYFPRDLWMPGCDNQPRRQGRGYLPPFERREIDTTWETPSSSMTLICHTPGERFLVSRLNMYMSSDSL